MARASEGSDLDELSELSGLSELNVRRQGTARKKRGPGAAAFEKLGSPARAKKSSSHLWSMADFGIALSALATDARAVKLLLFK